MKIFKYEVFLLNSFSICMPENSTILSFQVQNEKPYIWVLVDEEKPIISRYFTIIGTGHYIELSKNVLKYIGTVLMNRDELVWHLFEDLT